MFLLTLKPDFFEKRMETFLQGVVHFLAMVYTLQKKTVPIFLKIQFTKRGETFFGECIFKDLHLP